MQYILAILWVLGAVTWIYRKLFSPNKTNEPKEEVPPTFSKQQHDFFSGRRNQKNIDYRGRLIKMDEQTSSLFEESKN